MSHTRASSLQTPQLSRLSQAARKYNRCWPFDFINQLHQQYIKPVFNKVILLDQHSPKHIFTNTCKCIPYLKNLFFERVLCLQTTIFFKGLYNVIISVFKTCIAPGTSHKLFRKFLINIYLCCFINKHDW